MEGTEVMAMLCFFGFLGFAIYMFFSTRHRERMALIESGQDAGIFNRTSKSLSSLKWGLVMVAIGLGLGIGITTDISMDNDGPVITFPAVFICAGMALLIFYYLTRDTKEDDTV